MSDSVLETLNGPAELAQVATGTGSAHTGVVITVGGERLELVRIDGNPFNDAPTRALAGHDIEVVGYRSGAKFRYRSARVLR